MIQRMPPTTGQSRQRDVHRHRSLPVAGKRGQGRPCGTRDLNRADGTGKSRRSRTHRERRRHLSHRHGRQNRPCSAGSHRYPMTCMRSPPAADWLMWRGTYATQSFSPLTQIDKNTVRNLGVCVDRVAAAQCQRDCALVHDGVLFVRKRQYGGSHQRRGCSILWRYIRPLPESHAQRQRSTDEGSGDLRGKPVCPDRRRTHRCAEPSKRVICAGIMRWSLRNMSAPRPVRRRYFHISGGPLVVRER